MDHCCENIDIFPGCISPNRVVAENTMTGILLIMMFMFPVCLATSHRGDTAVPGLGLVKSPVGCAVSR